MWSWGLGAVFSTILVLTPRHTVTQLVLPSQAHSSNTAKYLRESEAAYKSFHGIADRMKWETSSQAAAQFSPRDMIVGKSNMHEAIFPTVPGILQGVRTAGTGVGAASSTGADPSSSGGGSQHHCTICEARFRTENELRGHITGKHRGRTWQVPEVSASPGPPATCQETTPPDADDSCARNMENLKIQRRGRLRYGPGGHLGDADVMRAEQYAIDVCTAVHSTVDDALDKMGTTPVEPQQLKAVLAPLFAAANKPLNVKTEKKKREEMLAENG